MDEPIGEFLILLSSYYIIIYGINNMRSIFGKTV